MKSPLMKHEPNELACDVDPEYVIAESVAERTKFGKTAPAKVMKCVLVVFPKRSSSNVPPGALRSLLRPIRMPEMLVFDLLMNLPPGLMISESPAAANPRMLSAVPLVRPEELLTTPPASMIMS